MKLIEFNLEELIDEADLYFDGDGLEEFFKDFDNAIKKLSDKDRFDLFTYMYTSYIKDCLYIYKYFKDYVLTTTDKEYENIKNNIKFDENGKVKVFRGINELNLGESGLSWTLDKDIAERFAQVQEILNEDGEFIGYTEKGYVIEKEITINEILFYKKQYSNFGYIVEEQEVFLTR